MLQIATLPSEAANKPEVVKAVLDHAEALAFDSFWEFRVYMVRSLAKRSTSA
jgi:hypothetical protein